MKTLTLTFAAPLFLFFAVESANAQNEAYSAESNEGIFGLYNLLADDLGCGPIKNLSGTVSNLERGEGDGTSIYSFVLSPAKGRRMTIPAIISDAEIPPDEVTNFLVKGQKVFVKARNCDGQMTAVQIVERLK